MNVRQFLDEHDYLYSDLNARKDESTEGLIIVKTDNGLLFAINPQTGAILRNKKEWAEKDQEGR